MVKKISFTGIKDGKELSRLISDVHTRHQVKFLGCRTVTEMRLDSYRSTKKEALEVPGLGGIKVKFVEDGSSSAEITLTGFDESSDYFKRLVGDYEGIREMYIRRNYPQWF